MSHDSVVERTDTVDRMTWSNFRVEVADQVARIHIHGPNHEPEGEFADPHWELAQILNGLQLDNRVRVVVLAGAEDGVFQVPGGDTSRHVSQEASFLWKASTGIVKLHEAMATLDRPVVAKVNGDAVGFGASLVFAADLIYAREDARVVDNHLGMGEVTPAVGSFGVLPGDGGAALLPLFLSPAKAKEYLMLAKAYTGAELAALGVINAAVPAADLDEHVEDVVAALLRRSAYALAWTKRVANKHVVDQLNRTLDAGIAYELVNLYQLFASGADTSTLG